MYLVIMTYLTNRCSIQPTKGLLATLWKLTNNFPRCVPVPFTVERGLYGRQPVSFRDGVDAHSSSAASDRKKGDSSPTSGE